MKIVRIGMFLLLSDFKLFTLKILDTGRLYIFDNADPRYKVEGGPVCIVSMTKKALPIYCQQIDTIVSAM